jgi:hypothetical protein
MVVTLQWMVAGGVTIHAARMGKHFPNFAPKMIRERSAEFEIDAKSAGFFSVGFSETGSALPGEVSPAGAASARTTSLPTRKAGWNVLSMKS